MIWLTWRQFRAQALAGLTALAAIAAYLIVLGLRIRHTYEVSTGCAGCTAQSIRTVMDNKYADVLQLTGFLVLLVPAVLGAFWGAPLIARELETGTHRLVWNQSVTRTRWLTVKLAMVTLGAVVLTGALSALVTWAASPYDGLIDERFEPLLFPTRNIVPLGYAAFAVLAGATIGLLTRRTVLAMAITLAVFALVQILMPTVVRPHLRTPVSESVAFAATGTTFLGSSGDGGDGRISVQEYKVPGAWVLTPNAPLLDVAGHQVTSRQIRGCMVGDGPDDFVCIEKMNLHLDLEYQPGNRYWAFQWLELAVYLVLGGLLAGFAFWRIPRGLS
jgi:ABC-type transport system involved in multi-copper enzyme maturation permease subunit